MLTINQHIAIPPSESSSKKIKVFLPNIKDLNDLLKKSNRFEKFGITTFGDIIKYLKHFYKIEIIPLYIDEDSINKDDLVSFSVGGKRDQPFAIMVKKMDYMP